MGSAFTFGLQRAEDRRRDREAHVDAQRQAQLQDLADAGLTPEQQAQGIKDLYANDPSTLRQHVANLAGRLVGRKPQPVVAPGGSRRDFQNILRQGTTPEQRAQATFTAEGESRNRQTQAEAQQEQQNTFALIDKYIADPEQNKAAKEDYVRKQAGIQNTFKALPGAAGQPYKTPNGTWVRPIQAADGTITEQPMPSGYNGPQAKPARPLYKVIRNHAVLLDPNTGKVLHDLGLATEARTTTRQVAIPDANGVVHIENLTSVTTPGGDSVDVDMAPEDAPQGGAPKGPAPKRTAAAQPATPAASRTLGFRKGTPASNKAQGDYVEAVKLASIADQVSQHPNDAINQKRLAVALERASAGRFTTQALDYIIKAGWGNTLEQWANNPSTGALPPDVLRQLVDGAHQNVTAAKAAVDAVSGLAPKAENSGGNVIVVHPEDMK